MYKTFTFHGTIYRTIWSSRGGWGGGVCLLEKKILALDMQGKNDSKGELKNNLASKIGKKNNNLALCLKLYVTRKSITYNYMLYKGVVVSKINNHYSIIYLGLTN